MNIHTSQSAQQHEQVSMLLPWYLNQTLDATERQQVENHIRGCLQCRRELVHLRRLAATVKQTSDLDAAAMASFDRMRARLQAVRPQTDLPDANQSVARLEKPNHHMPSVGGNVIRRPQPSWDFIHKQGIRLAIAASVLLAIIPFALRHGPTAPARDGYYTLSDAKPEPSAGAHLRVVFSKSISASGIDDLLSQIHGQRVEGPNSIGAYTVRLDSAKGSPEVDTAIGFLRSQQVVMLAEPVLGQP